MATIDPPYRLDPLQNIVNVKWGGDQFMTFVLPIVHSPTPDFQRTHFTRQNTDYGVQESEDAEAQGFNFWPAYATEFQWIFARQAIVLHNWNGTSWETCQFNLDVTPIEGFVIGGGKGGSLANPSNPDNKTKPPKTLTGLPTLPSAVQSGGIGLVCAALGTSPGIFWPQGEWIKPVGAPVTVPGQTKPLRLQISTTESVPFVTCSSVTARMRGIELDGNSGSLPGGIFQHDIPGVELVKAWIAEMNVGFRPEGGPASNAILAAQTNPDLPSKIFGDLVVNISGITATQGDKTWKGKGAALAQPLPTVGIGGGVFTRFQGALYVLLEKVVT